MNGNRKSRPGKRGDQLERCRRIECGGIALNETYIFVYNSVVLFEGLVILSLKLSRFLQGRVIRDDRFIRENTLL